MAAPIIVPAEPGYFFVYTSAPYQLHREPVIAWHVGEHFETHEPFITPVTAGPTGGGEGGGVLYPDGRVWALDRFDPSIKEYLDLDAQDWARAAEDDNEAPWPFGGVDLPQHPRPSPVSHAA